MKIVRKIISGGFSLLPSTAPEFIYKTILKPWPLRQITNNILSRLIPEKILLEEGWLFLNKKDPVVSGALALGVYEQDEIKLFKSLIKPGMTILDIGANIGYYTLVASHHAESSGKVLSFEPEPENYKILKKNTQNKKNTQVFQYALGDKKTEKKLYLSSSNKGKHSLAPLEGESNSIQVPIITLDEVLQEINIDKVDIIKMDIEGAEALAFAGMSETLKKSPTCIIFCEFYPEALTLMGSNPLNFLSDLSNRGFVIYEIEKEEKKHIPPESFAAFIKKFRGSTTYSNLYCVGVE